MSEELAVVPSGGSIALPEPPHDAERGSTFAGGGEMGALMRATDWSRTPLGPPATWPQSLHTAISIMLEARFPMVVAWGADFRFFYNDGYRPILGKTKHPGALGTPGREIFPEVWSVVGPEFERVRRGESFAVEDWLLPLDRNGYLENCWFTLSYSPIRDESGGVGGLLAVVAETTGRVEGERRLSTLRELAKRTAEAKTETGACEAAAAIFETNQLDVPFSLAYLLDSDGRRARLVAASSLTPGAPAAPLEIDLAVNRGDPGASWPIASVVDSRQLDVVRELGARFGRLPGGPDGDSAHTAVLLPLARIAGGAVDGVLIMGVSPRRALDDRYQGFYELAAEHLTAAIANARAYEAERRRAEALAELDRAKTAFFSNVSHEFRTPLTLMLGPLEALLSGARGAVPPEMRDDVGTAHRNALRLLKLVNTLLDFARIEAGRVNAMYEPTDLSQLTRELASAFESAAARGGLQLTIDCPPLPEAVYVDREMWEKIALNLLSNALKFTFDGEIRVQLRWKGDAVEMEVADTGVGIPPSELPHIFERFHRVHGTRSRTHEGTGIGLALVRDLVRLHGGRIEVRSVVGEGTAFTVTLPAGSSHLPQQKIGAERAQTSTAVRADVYVDEVEQWLPLADVAPAGTVHADEATDVSRPRILIVDDNADMRAHLGRILAPLYEIATAGDGVDALAQIEQRLPYLVLSDIMMPRMDGFALLQAIRDGARTQNLPVILVSARAGEESTIEGLSAGADDYLVKPFAARELLARVRTNLELVRVRAEAREQVIATLERERSRLTAIFEHAPAFITVFRGPNHVFESANAAYRQRIGNRDFLGKPVREVLPELEGQGYVELLDEVFTTGRSYVGAEARVVLRAPDRAGPDERFVNFVYQPLIETDGRVTGILVHGVDVTDQVRARQEIDELYQRVRQANDAKTQFLANMSHELRTPLNAILGYVDLLALGVRGALSDGQLVDIERIRSASRYLLSLINDVLSFARVEAGQVAFQLQPVDVRVLFARANELVAQRATDKGITLDIIAPSDAVSIRADAERAQQILLNLLTNAVKFSDRGGCVTLSCTSDANAVRIHVRDTGRGIPADQRERIFEPFVQLAPRVPANARELPAGVGLGLAISRDYARKMDGELTVVSEDGVGSEFTLTLPRASTASARAGSE